MKRFITILFLLSPVLTVSAGGITPGDSIKVGLVMSGGGAKGLFHIGVLKALEENDIPVDYVAGTSMGAIVAGMYAMGYTPDEMIDYFSSKSFDDLLKGTVPVKYRFFSQEMDETSEMLYINFDLKHKELKPVLPTNLISPYRMDLEFIRLTSAATAACKNSFDSLMIPFRCVASDISAHKPYVMRNGNLGTAIRASMSYPFVFKPVVIDSTLLFDGGVYNNFPWDVMAGDFKPDVIIGSICTSNIDPPSESDIISQISNMLTTETDYTLPDSTGILIEESFPKVKFLDFWKIHELVDSGYMAAVRKIDKIRKKIPVKRTAAEIAAMRKQFKSKCFTLKYEGATVRGGSEEQNISVQRLMTKDTKNTYTHEQLESRFYSIIAFNLVNSFYPVAEYDFEKQIYRPEFRISPSPVFKLSLGGNISSSSINMMYIGIEAMRWKKNLTRFRLNSNMGKQYSSLQIGARQDYPLSFPLFAEAYFTVSVYDFYKNSQDIFYDNIRPVFLKEYDGFFTANIGRGLTKNSKLKIGFTSGLQNIHYHKNVFFKSTDTLNKSNFPFFAVHMLIDKNTYNYKQYPTNGHYLKISLNGVWGKENHMDVSQSHTLKQSHNWVSASLVSDYYFNINKYLSLGTYLEFTASRKFTFFDYYPTIGMLPVFQPTPHSKTFLLENYRANTYLALGIKPIVKIGKSVSLQSDGYVFQPYKRLSADMSYDKLPKPLFMASTALIWHSPAGPLSVSLNYYERNYNNLYFLVNFGYLIFNQKGIKY
ncbi:MAG: patatin-like phospholipase family protein [Prevotellaceae bacterium]|jgi:NTE family protein|nr:patatin-like phospholipase family protein [Prevotellaceae bacterium]